MQLIVHPRFLHTLGSGGPPLPLATRPRPDWHALPLEVVTHIAGFLDKPQDLLNLASICRDARALASSDVLWRDLCRCGFCVPPDLPDQAPKASEPGFWLRLYRYNHELFVGVMRSSGSSGSSAGGFVGPRFSNGPLVINLT